MTRYECMQRLATRLKDELVILSLGGSVDEWYNAAPHMREASLFQQQLGCVTPEAFGLAVGLPERNTPPQMAAPSPSLVTRMVRMSASASSAG